ncbi:SDR family oxidoreductase [Accumulibacter sp.]|uniref:SDR family oxidoreductase n=1 Tax=Accumulibacter sp. TaxID=2053492 RepID=UPI0025EAEEF0|nr:SDR family oxidoreductase [Accumulibacter sp.]MCP5229635.1 SDR family oxidoreductase [Accumulibacter sp.]
MQKLLIVGCGDIARRLLPRLLGHYRVFTLVRDPEQLAFWRGQGSIPILADLDRPGTLKRIAGLADVIIHLAPPAARQAGRQVGRRDIRTRYLLAALASGLSLPQRLVYISTSGVYGDCAGARVDETRSPSPATVRACRRLDAERQLRAFGRRSGVVVSILRAPGIYAADRLPIERLRRGVAALCKADDVYTNHIHADDLARVTHAALRYGRSNRSYNASDDSEIRMGDYFDLVADRLGLPRAPRLSRNEAKASLSPMQWSFMSESRRLANQRIKRELRVTLRYPRVEDGVAAALHERKHQCS